MNSTELIESCKKMFKEYHEERESFEQEMYNWLLHQVEQGNIQVTDTLSVKRSIEYFLCSCKSFHWRSFYNGFLFGATQSLKDDKRSNTIQE